MGAFTFPAKVPSPKSHDTAAPPIDALLKLTVNPAHALLGLKVNNACGASLKQILSCIVFTHLPSALVIVTMMVPVLPPPQVIFIGLVVVEEGTPPVTTHV